MFRGDHSRVGAPPSLPTGYDASPLLEQRTTPGREGRFYDARETPEFTHALEHDEDLGIRYVDRQDPTYNPSDNEQPPGNVPYQGYSTEFEVDDSQSRRYRASAGSFQSLLSKNKDHVVAPWRHGSSNSNVALAIGSTTVQAFDNRSQRRRVLISCLIRWLITVAICGATAGVLVFFSKPDHLSETRKLVFNGVITGLLIAMSMELGSVLRQHARLWRWRFLASQYRTLKEFEMILSAESVTTITKLLWKGRTRGRWLPNKIQMVALFWIALNFAVQVFPAIMGLTYSLDPSDDNVDYKPGSDSISNLTQIALPSNAGSATPLFQASLANTYGLAGQFYSVLVDVPDKDQLYATSVYTDTNQTKYWHRFWDQNPESSQQPILGPSDRTVEIRSECQELQLLDGGYAGFGDATDAEGFIVFNDAQGKQRTEVAEGQRTGAVTWLSNFTSKACGPRCAQSYALLVADNDTVPHPRLWFCNTTVSSVLFPNDSYPNPQDYQMPDQTARLFAGAIGWSGAVTEVGDSGSAGLHASDLQDVVYSQGSTFHDIGVPFNDIQNTDVANLIMMFSAMAISAYDDLGPRMNVTGKFPVTALHLKVMWKYSAAILIGIPIGMLLVILAITVFASKAIIKDDSYLSTAKLLKPVVDKLGDKGCLLDGDEIADELGNFKIIYGVRTPGERPLSKEELVYGNVKKRTYSNLKDVVRHLDVIEESEGLGYIHGRMPAGHYDGGGKME